MAFSKFANANIIKPDINVPVWDQVRDSAQALGSAFATKEASRIALANYNPKDYMLTHCTIVASVDTEDGPGALGQQLESGSIIDRRYQDYYITPETSKFVNNNCDAWERKLLLSSFRTFIGGENYVEHLQIPEMSKGKIIDAAARDIGDSVYIDILVATHRKFKPLVASIQSGQLQTLSMGCNVAHTQCSKCGNVAADTTQLCRHIKYEKGNHFLDALGKTRKIAELCGHISEEPGSVRFIEASWVANPAFTGAVLRNILTPEEATVYNNLHAAKVQVALSTPSRVADPTQMARAARLNAKAGFDFGQEEEFEGAGDSKGNDAKGNLDDAVEDMAKAIKDKAMRKLRDELNPPAKAPNDLNENKNETLIKEASQNPEWRKTAKRVLAMVNKDPVVARRILLGLLYHKQGGWKAVRASNEFSGPEVLALSRVLDALQGVPKIAGESRIYRTVLAVGGASAYQDENTYLAACRRVLGRQPTESEATSLIVKGKLFDLGQ